MISIENALKLRRECVNNVNDSIDIFIGILAATLYENHIICKKTNITSDGTVSFKPLSKIRKHIRSIEVRQSSAFEIYNILDRYVFDHRAMNGETNHRSVYKDKYAKPFQTYSNIIYLTIEIKCVGYSDSRKYVIPFGLYQHKVDKKGSTDIVDYQGIFIPIAAEVNTPQYLDSYHKTLFLEKILNSINSTLKEYGDLKK